MSDTSQHLVALLSAHYGQEDVVVDESQPTLRINLHPDTLSIWEEEYNRAHSSNGNLLLACESSSGPIESTSLTWVVGSAIRRVQVKSHNECQILLQSIGLEPEMTAAITRNCPGIAFDSIWAIYYERHGDVVASPVLPSEIRNDIAMKIPPA
jgi:hypothetical protein